MVPLQDTKVDITVLDLETTAVNGDPDWANPHNRIVLAGFANLDGDYLDIADEGGIRSFLGAKEATIDMLVGHNLPFDLGYLDSRGFIDITDERFRIWDTQVAEYILSGQQDKFISLEKVAKKYGIVFMKDDDVTAIFESGRGADAVPPEKLRPYLKADVHTTRNVFEEQWRAADKLGMLPLIQAMMEFRLATIRMRTVGWLIDTDALSYTKGVCEDTINTAKKEIAATIGRTTVRYTCMSEFDPLKPPQLQKWLFGGDIKVKDKEPNGTYKNGKPKFKTVEKTIKINGMLVDNGMSDTRGDCTTSEENLQHIVDDFNRRPMISLVCADIKTILEQVLIARKAMKILSTYVEPTELYARQYGGVLRPTVQCTSTHTGRTSCTGPNLQNVPKGSVGLYRRAMTARHGRTLVEFDYSQLEVVGLALLSGDKQLIEDCTKGIDIHTTIYKSVHHRKPTKEQRRQFKRAVFALIYGAGAKAIAMQGGCSVAIARQIMQEWRLRYPDTIRFRDTVLTAVKNNAMIHPERKFGIPHKVGHWVSPTGRRYVFTQRLMEDFATHSKKCDWAVQEIANYPVQGAATADIVPIMVAEAYRFIHGDGRKLLKPEHRQTELLMAVHDSAVFEVDSEAAPVLIPAIKKVLESVPNVLKNTFDIDTLGLPFNVGVAVGSNWEDMKDL